MAEGTEPIRQDIEGLRGSMTDTLEQIETRVRSTVDTTVDNVRQTFDIKRQVGEKPWLSLGLAVAAGYLLGSTGGNDEPPAPQYGQPGQPMRYYSESGNRPESSPRYGNDYSDQSYGGRPSYTGSQSHSTSSYSTPNQGPSSPSYGGQNFAPNSNFNSSQFYNQARQDQSSGMLGNMMSGAMGGMLSRMAAPLGDELQTIAQAAVNSAVRMLRESLQSSIPQFDAEYQRARGTSPTDASRSSEPGTYSSSDPSSYGSLGGGGSNYGATPSSDIGRTSSGEIGDYSRSSTTTGADRSGTGRSEL